jgi:hypothetical protein
MCISPRRDKGPDIATIPAQAASTSLFSEPPVPVGQTCRQLRCFIEGDFVPSTVTVSLNREIEYLKELIHEKNKYSLSASGIDAKDLVLLKVRNS